MIQSPIQLLEEAEPQERTTDEVEESKAHKPDHWNSRAASLSPAMEDKQPQSMILQESPFLADQSFGLEPPHM